MLNHMLTLNENSRFDSAVAKIIMAFYLAGIICIGINPNYTNKIINIAGAVSFVMLAIGYRKLPAIDRNVFILAIPLLLLGGIDLIWYGLYKNPDVLYKNGYRGYLEAGKMLIAAAFTVIYFSRVRHVVYKYEFLIAAIIAQAIILGRSFYQGIYLGAERISVSAMGGNIGQMGAATIAAYMLTFCSLFASIVFLKSEVKYRWILFYANFILTLSAVVMTGTRSAIVTYPLMIILLIIIEHRQHKKRMLKITSSIAGLLILCGIAFHDNVDERVNAMTQDITQYQKNNSDTSVGARLSMMQAGFNSSPVTGWQSLEVRGDKVIALDKQDAIYAGAVRFLNVHMHNEIAEAYSIRGISGVALIFALYLGMALYCLKSKNYGLLVFPLAIFLFGLSDVVTHAKPIPASWIVSLLLAVILCNESARNTGSRRPTES
ncbi:O-antigen ligase family protein [Shimwellia blattae]|nr:O-antigen ligase family protein [Shimwellia blattae]